ncbi:2604_t:CDS:2, partial [Scutellospora calospora]
RSIPPDLETEKKKDLLEKVLKQKINNGYKVKSDLLRHNGKTKTPASTQTELV